MAYNVCAKKVSLDSSSRIRHFLDLDRIYRAKLWIFPELVTHQQYPSSLTEEVLTRGYSHACECCIIMYQLENNIRSISNGKLLRYKNNFQIWNTQSIKTRCAHVTSWKCKKDFIQKQAPSVTIRSNRKKYWEICSELIGL